MQRGQKYKYRITSSVAIATTVKFTDELTSVPFRTFVVGCELILFLHCECWYNM